MLGAERVLLVGEGPQVETLARKLGSHPEYAIEPVGLISRSDESSTAPRRPAAARAPSTTSTSRAWPRTTASSASSSPTRTTTASGSSPCSAAAASSGLKLSLLPQLFDALGPSVELDDVEGVTVLGITPPVLPRSSRFLKRAMDVLGAAVLLLFAAPAIAVAAIAIKLDSPGPAFFRQTRIGREGRRFQLLKCRTMCADAEQRRAELMARSKDPGWLHVDDDPRVTRVGRFLRHSSLDELPQLWNVLRGEMSLVGPRPILADEDRQLEGWRRTRIDLTPGDHRALAGARPDQHPVRGDDQTRLPVRHQLVAVDRLQPDPPDPAGGLPQAWRQLAVAR